VVAGAVSMALGDYVSVSSQRDTERALLAKERTELARFPERELDALTAMYTAKGLTVGTARLVAEEPTAKDAFAAHADIELQIGPDSLTNPRHAGGASAIAFTVGSLLPLIAYRDPAATTRREGGRDVCCRGLAFAATGAMSAKLGSAGVGRAVARLVTGGALAMAVTFAIGQFVGATVL
jgi:vacuolar iron transporter family protein